MNPHSGRAASSNDPSTWATAAEAWNAKKRYGWAGIGYVFTIGAGVVGVDLDDCFDEDGRLHSYASQIVQMLNSYTERSPSGIGLHILACGSIPHSVKKPTFEMYNELRYFTVTGRQYGAAAVDEGIASGDIEDRDKELNALFVVYDGDVEPQPAPRRIVNNASDGPTEAEVANALRFIPPHGDYNADWLPVLMAIHSAFPDERGVALAEAWSPGYRGEVARKWRSFNSTERSGITIATLFHRAKEFGWRPEPKAQPARAGRRMGSDITDALAQRRRGNGYAI
jgi:hypothetical protein